MVKNKKTNKQTAKKAVKQENKSKYLSQSERSSFRKKLDAYTNKLDEYYGKHKPLTIKRHLKNATSIDSRVKTTTEDYQVVLAALEEDVNQQDKIPSNSTNGLHLITHEEAAQAERKAKESTKARPIWAVPHIDKNGDITSWSAKPNLLAKTILKENDIFSAVDQSGKCTYYLYNGDYWEPIDLAGIRNLVASYFNDNKDIKAYDLLTSRVVNDTTNLVASLTDRENYLDTFDKPEHDLNYIPFNNFDYECYTGKNVEHSPRRYFTYKRDYDIDLHGTAPKTNAWLLESLGGDKQATKLMKIFIGASFWRSYKPLQFMVFIKGKGEDGKSVFLDYWGNKLIGSLTNSHLSFDQITRVGTNFSLGELYHKELNTYDDLNASYIDSSMMGTVKQLTGGNPFDAEIKNKGDLRFPNYATMVFATNEMPTIQGLGYAEQRRIFIFNWHKIDNWENKYGMPSLIKERGAFAKECIDSFFLVKLQRDIGKSQAEVLPKSKVIEDNWRQFQLDSDPVARYIAARCYSDPNPKHDCGWIVSKQKLYEDFLNWADKHNDSAIRKLTYRKFNKRVASLGFQDKIRKIGGESTRVFVNIKLLPDGCENDTESTIGLEEVDF